MEVLEIAGVIGLHVATTAAPIALEELRAAGLLDAESDGQALSKKGTTPVSVPLACASSPVIVMLSSTGGACVVG